MVVDCGGGTVDITVYEMEAKYGCLKELHKATGGPYGSVGLYTCTSVILVSPAVCLCSTNTVLTISRVINVSSNLP